MKAKNSAGKVVYCHGAGTANFVACDRIRVSHAGVMSENGGEPSGTGWGTDTRCRIAALACRGLFARKNRRQAAAPFAK